MEIYNWVDEVIQQLNSQMDASGALNLLALSSGRAIADLGAFSRMSKYYSNLKFAISSTLGVAQEHASTVQWFDFLSNHLLYLSACQRASDPRTIFDNFNQSFSFFTKLFKTLPEGKWSAPIVQWFCYELYRLAKTADKEAESTGKKTVNLNEAVRSVQQLFAVCQSSSQEFPDSKLYSVIYCINTLFKIFFSLDMIQSCQTPIKWFEQNYGKIRLDGYPMSAQVTFRYFAGRMALYQMEIPKAEEHLQFVMAHCNKKSMKNRRLAIRYLTPVRLLMGSYPSEALLEKYKLKEYVGISQAVRAGDLKRFSEELEKYEELYISKGVYLVVDKLRTVTYRNLFKRAVKVLNTGTGSMRLEKFQQAVQWLLPTPADSLETECVLANLINQGFMKAYISHEKQIIVMSKTKEVFPPLQSIYAAAK